MPTYACALGISLMVLACGSTPIEALDDAGLNSSDAGVPEAPDSGLEADSGTPMADAGTPPPPPPRDGGTPPRPDTGTPPPPPGPDAGTGFATSDGQCPAMDRSGIAQFQSGGLNRKVGIAIPNGSAGPKALIFSFHGLVGTDAQPVENGMASLQGIADATGAILVAPEAQAQSIPAFGSFLLWGIMNNEADDLTLFDDLVTCAKELLEVDEDRISVFGHSGGALWTSVVLFQRSEILASVVQFSGGSDVFRGRWVTYATPAADVPALLVTGGANDLWPEQFPLIRFEEATDTLQAGLVNDGHFVIRCGHELGHFQIPQEGYNLGFDFLLNHRRAEASNFLSSGRLDQESDWCVVAE